MNWWKKIAKGEILTAEDLGMTEEEYKELAKERKEFEKRLFYPKD